MKIYAITENQLINRQNCNCKKTNSENFKNLEYANAPVPVSTLKAYNLSFGKKINLGVWTPNLDTGSIEYTIHSPYQDAAFAILGKKQEEGNANNINDALCNYFPKDRSGNFLFSIPVLNRVNNSIIDDKIEIEKIVFYDKNLEELGERQINETIFPKTIMSKALPQSYMKINGVNYPQKLVVLSEASVEGKFVKASFDEVKRYNGEEPIIVFFDNPKDFFGLTGYIEHSSLHPNIKGVIGAINDFDSSSLNGLTHNISRIRGRIAVACVDPEDAEAVKTKIEAIGEPYLRVKAEPNILDLKGINKLTPIKKSVINLPHNDMVDKILRPEDPEFTQSSVGLKAYNLGELKKLQTGGGFKIPDFCVIPAGMLARMEMPEDFEKKVQEIDKTQDPELLHQGLKQLREDIIRTKLPDDIISEIKDVANDLLENNLKKNGRCLIARSSFNGEDSALMATQGLYDSFPGLKNELLLDRGIKQVVASKWSNLAYNSRKNNSIPHDAVQPNVIVQEVVPVDYTFTIYTADPRTNNKNKMMIDLSQGVSCACFGNPYIFEYDKTSHTSKRTQLAQKAYMQPINQMPNPNLSPLGLERCDYSKDPLNMSQKHYAPIMDKIFNVAQYIEDNFGGRPQDIEGGIIFKRDDSGNVIDADVYIWQTRDAHLLKK